METAQVVCPTCGEEIKGYGKTEAEAQIDAMYNLKEHQEKGCK